MNERDENLLLNIKDEAEVLLEITDGYDLQSFLDNELLKRGVSMALITIGEFVKSLSEDFKKKNQEVPWRFIAGLRDIAAHGYHTLQMERIWDVVIKDVPELLELVKGILLTEEGEREGNY